MLLKTDQQKVHTMVIEAITMLCKNGLDYQQEFSVEGLLGITLDNKEVFLVNIKESVKSAQLQSPSQSEATRRQDEQGHGQGHDQAHGQDQGQCHDQAHGQGQGHGHGNPADPASGSDPLATAAAAAAFMAAAHHPRFGGCRRGHRGGFHMGGAGEIVARALTPMVQGFWPPFRGGPRGRRRMGCMQALRRKFANPERLGSFPHGPPWAMGDAEMGPRHKRPNLAEDSEAATETDMTAPRPKHKFPITIGVDLIPRDAIAVPINEEQRMDLHETAVAPTVKVEPSDLPSLDNDGVLLIDEDTGLSDNNNLPKVGGDYAPSPSSRSSASAADEDVSVLNWPDTGGEWEYGDTASPHGSNQSDNDRGTASPSNIDLNIVDRVLIAILKEDGCFVTSRMLCRRYSAMFKSHSVVAAMKLITRPLEAEDHVGIFKCLNERTKVFFKCPPHHIKPSVLQRHGLTNAQYKENYFRLPKPKGMKAPGWDTFVGYVLQNCPYGQVNADDLKAPMKDEEEEEPQGRFDEFELQRFIVHCEGAFVSSRILCRRITKSYRVVNVIRAMKAMSRRPGDKHYIGEFVKVSERIKIFFKCPPRMLGAEALQLYNLTEGEYQRIYQASPRPIDGSVSNWDSYMESVMCRCPYSLSDFPLEACEINPDVADKIRIMLSQLTLGGDGGGSVTGGRDSPAATAYQSPTTAFIDFGSEQGAPSSLSEVGHVTAESASLLTNPTLDHTQAISASAMEALASDHIRQLLQTHDGASQSSASEFETSEDFG